MSDNGVLSVYELSSGELEGDNTSDYKFKYNFIPDSSPLNMGHNGEFSNNGGTSTGNIGLNLLQNFDEGNLFQCDITGVYEWIRQRTDSVSSTDLEPMKIDCNEAIITTCELTSNEESVGDIDNAIQIDSVYSINEPNQTQNDNISSSFLEDWTGLQADEQLTKDNDPLINTPAFQYNTHSQQEKTDNIISSPCSNEKDSHILLKDYKINENNSLGRAETSDIESKLKFLKKEPLPFVKIPKKCILSGKILKKDDLQTIQVGNILPLLDAPELVQENCPLEVSNESTTQSNGTVFENVEQLQIMLTEDKASDYIDEVLKTNDSEPTCEAIQSEAPTITEKNALEKTVVAISTNKLEDVTEIIIKTETGEQLYKGKASDLLKATSLTSNVMLKFDSYKKEELKPQLDKADFLLLQTNNEEQAILEDDKNEDIGTNEEEPITEALKSLGIANDHWDNFEIILSKGQQRVWLCPQDNCNEIFLKLSYLKIHVLTHYKVRPFKCNYEGCEWSFYTNYKLKRHKETHLKKKEFKCPAKDCDRKFSTIYNLHTHLKLHNRPADLLCIVPGCNQAFQTRRNMENHLKEHGTEHAPYVCDYEGCNKRYYSTSALHSHCRTHQHNIDDLRCQYCLKVFDKPCRLKAHIRSHTGVKPYKCMYEGCDWAFTTSSKLHRHQAKHTQERRFACNVCCKAFLRSEHLKDHSLKHFLTKSFTCPIAGCGLQFTAKSSLYVHMKKHRKKAESESAQEGTLQKETEIISVMPDVSNCPVLGCSYVFSSRDDITAHMQTSHKSKTLDVKNVSGLESIELIPGEDNLFSLEGLQFKPGTTLTDLNFMNLGAEGVIVSFPELITTSSDSGLQSAIQQVELTEDIQDVAAKTICVNDSPVNIITTSVDIGSARTGITYQDALAERELRKSSNKKLVHNLKKEDSSHSVSPSKENCSIHVTSDVVLTAGLLGGSQENLTRGLIFQEDLPSSTDFYASIQEDGSLIGSSSGEFQVYLLESPSVVRHSDFEQSTINLRDLE